MGLRRQRGSAPHLVWLHSVFARAGDELRSMVLIRLGYIDFDADGSVRHSSHLLLSFQPLPTYMAAAPHARVRRRNAHYTHRLRAPSLASL
uniref:Uncharacterized protein n=1 Tax=Triticum urartu TaxID=4572 RepID=A0A8R7TUZ2_TRIUA